MYLLYNNINYLYSIRVNLEDHYFHSSKTGLEDSLNTFLWWTVSRQTCVYVFSCLTLSLILFTALRTATFVSVCMSSSMNLHNKMFNSITRATMRFFNTNSSGKILKLILINLIYKNNINTINFFL